MTFFDIPGCTFIGYIQADDVNGGIPVPLFSPAPPPDGNLDINTMEGWNSVAEKHNRRSFRSEFGRDPADAEELDRWIQTQIEA